MKLLERLLNSAFGERLVIDRLIRFRRSRRTATQIDCRPASTAVYWVSLEGRPWIVCSEVRNPDPYLPGMSDKPELGIFSQPCPSGRICVA